MHFVRSQPTETQTRNSLNPSPLTLSLDPNADFHFDGSLCLTRSISVCVSVSDTHLHTTAHWDSCDGWTCLLVVHTHILSRARSLSHPRPPTHYSTLGQLRRLDMTGRCLALTRHDVRPQGLVFQAGAAPISQDAWVWRAPLPPTLSEIDFKLGKPGCDNRFAYELRRAGLRVHVHTHSHTHRT
jgi:hypothetical protein